MKSNATFSAVAKWLGTAKRILANTLLIAIFAVFAVSPAYASEHEDTTAPDDVVNVEAVAGNGEITLSWDVTTDDTGVVGYNVWYGIQAVTNEGGEYTEWLDAGSVVEFVVADLTNEQDYYFAITAYDAAGNESVNYSQETSATPSGDNPDTDAEAPQVSSAVARYQTVVKVVFTEEVALPSAVPELAFQITNTKTLEVLDVSEAVYATDYLGDLYAADDTKTIQEKADELSRTIVLMTDPQVVGDEYKLEVSIDVEDLAGNPVASGISDTGLFIGSGEAAPAEEDPIEEDPVEEDPIEEDPIVDEEGPEVVAAKAVSSTEVEVKFSEKIILSADPTNNFLIVSESDGDEELTIIGVVIEGNGAVVKLTTSAQMDVDYSLVALEVKDIAGNTIAIESSTSSFKGKAGDLVDNMAPENVTNLIADVVDKVIVRLSWTASENSAKDLADQILYVSENQGRDYDGGMTIGSDTEGYDVHGLKAGAEYWLKVSTIDSSGNESTGVQSSVTLPETGLPLVGLVLASAILPSALRRRKKK